MYAIVFIVSTFIRQFLLPNPFECFGDNAIVINWIVGLLLHPLAYWLVGWIYQRGAFPTLGSLLYLIAYASLTGILALMGIFSFAWWWVLIIVAAMIGISVLFAKIGRWLRGETW